MARPDTTMSAMQPDATTVLQQSSVPLKTEALSALGARLTARFTQYEWERRVAELQWERNARQYLGVYDPDIEQGMDINRSRAYPKVTRWKCVSMLSRLMNLLFPVDDKCWSVAPSPLPNLDDDDLQKILDMLMPPPQAAGDGGPGSAMPAAPQPQQPPSDEQIEAAIRDFARRRADCMELEIEDQLDELGGGHRISYTALCRKVLASGIKYGAGILKGPFVVEQEQRTWQMDGTGRLVSTPIKRYRPRFDFVPLWNYYPDMSAKTLHSMDGQFEREVLSRHGLIELKSRPDFIASQIDVALRRWPNGNYKRRAYETEILALGPTLNTQHIAKNKYEAYVWTGYLQGSEIAELGIAVSDEQMQSDLHAVVWMIEDVVIKAMLDPWTTLLKGAGVPGTMQLYHHFIFEENESFILGNGLPQIMRDSQLSICAATRMMLDNGSIQRNVEVNLKLLSLNQDVSSVEPDKVWFREDIDPATVNVPAIRAVDLPFHVPELKQMIDTFMGFADAETFVNAATGGDMQRGPSEPFRTAAGASMLRGDAALPFKDVVRNFDCFTESVINSILLFNKLFNSGNEQIKGDFTPIARGATSLIAKEVLGIQLDTMTQTLTDEEKRYLKPRNLLRAKVRVRDLEVDDLVMTDEECDAVDAQFEQQQQQAQQQAQEMAAAQLRQILAAALKDISQAGKNTATAQADTANVMLNAMEKGLNPDSLTPQGVANANASTGAVPSTSPNPAGAQPAGGTDGAGAPVPGGTGAVSAPAAIGAQVGSGPVEPAAMPAG
jgi:hypothetical protein